MQDADEPNATDLEVERARANLERAHARLVATVKKALAEGQGPARIARHSDWSREYIGQIRDGKAGGVYGRKRATSAKKPADKSGGGD